MSIGLGDNEAILSQAMRDVTDKWQNTSTTWQDKARDDFDRKHFEELLAAAKGAQHAMKAVDDLLRQAIRECS
jgi:hypothetical protein